MCTFSSSCVDNVTRAVWILGYKDFETFHQYFAILFIQCSRIKNSRDWPGG